MGRVMPEHVSPDDSYQSTLTGHVCGIDEAGRGPLAGPVVAAAVIWHPDTMLAGLNDSKKLAKQKRAALCDAIMRSCLIGVGAASVAEIDHLNILQATKLAMQRAFAGLGHPVEHALIDGNQPPELPCHTHPIIRGDRQSRAIAAASIVAKTLRDRWMAAYDQQYPAYGFARHAGYGTKAHLAALNDHGPCPQHRHSFAPVEKAARQHAEANTI